MSEPIATTRKTIVGGRTKVREAITAASDAGLLVTYTEPVADPERPGCVRVDLVLIVEEPGNSRVTSISTDLVPVAPIAHTRTVPPRRLRRTRKVYRRVRVVQPITVIRTLEIGGGVIVAAGVGWFVYELVLAVIALVHWIIRYWPEIVVALILLALGAGYVCPKRGRR